ncbi:MAG: type III-A CRISPR-associated protein Cas10/Csm1 [Anaerostipes sp.]|nr:type III-A CRISPR-associated protein Cas10/Csm1 [Anaerostipes sp.]
MKERQFEVIIGSLLHDIGKVLHRFDDGRNHSQSGYDFLKNEVKMEQKEILDQVRYHHGKQLGQAKIADNSCAYITYIADNIASMTDRREKNTDNSGFQKDIPLHSIFNILNGNNQDKSYWPEMMDSNKINYPSDEKIEYREGFYADVKQRISRCLTEFSWKPDYINSLLEVLEATLSFIPSSTNKGELADISLYDHVKLTAAFASCIQEYLEEKHEENYKEILFQQAKKFYDDKVFLLYSLDISGIQSFIYTISSKGALKGLRARSFYLEIVVEHMIDELLFQNGLSRANLIYSGGGHAYILLSNTQMTKEKLLKFEAETNQWFLQNFSIELYIASGWKECSANDLRNEPKGIYQMIFQEISHQISEKKMNRYSAEDILKLNDNQPGVDGRECRVCKGSEHLNEDNECEICANLLKMSNDILHGKFFVVRGEKTTDALPLPGGRYLVSDNTTERLKDRMRSDHHYIRSYGKNEFFMGEAIATKLWVGDYVHGDDFKILGKSSQGLERLGILRADIDNLGQAFVRGFESEANGQRYVTLSRTATFSRKLSIFFKHHINYILENGRYFLKDREDKQRNAAIVYSGGDDVFVVGSWDDIIGFAIDLHQSLEKFSQGMLHISGGIGIYPISYPIALMAKETGVLEDTSKGVEGKNAITLFDENYVFSWNTLIQKILGEKFSLIQKFFHGRKEADKANGKNFLYHMLELIRGVKNGDKINLARYAYLLARMEPDKEASKEEKDEYERFSKTMYQWVKCSKEEDIKQLEMAIYIYVYLIREKGE